ncbi:MAG: hydroxymethylbilane synthase [Planctomycetes bacterium]|nr:hydroxymethylbilane synthase [Planctomycetota bacterium]
MPSSQTIRIATRASNLALWQANHIADLIRRAAPTVTVELVHVSTAGDRDQTERLRDLGSLGVFTREVQSAVLDGRADVAVHSLKDLPTEPVPGLVLAATPERGATADALVLPTGSPLTPELQALPQGARIGTGSPRRQAQLRFLRSDLVLDEVRGNVETRLRKLDEGGYDALVLAAAGLTRLGLGGRISCLLAPPLMFPAVSQGAVGVECRASDDSVRQILATITHSPTLAAATAERSLLSTLRAGCHAPLGVASSLHGDSLQLDAVILPQDGSHRWMASATAKADDALALGQQVAQLLLAQGAGRVLLGSN